MNQSTVVILTVASSISAICLFYIVRSIIRYLTLKSRARAWFVRGYEDSRTGRIVCPKFPDRMCQQFYQSGIDNADGDDFDDVFVTSDFWFNTVWTEFCK